MTFARPAPAGFEAALKSGRPVVTCEIAAGDSPDPAGLLKRAAAVRDHVDAVNIPDNTSGIAHLSGLAAAAILVDAGVEPILHVTCRDLNRIALQSHLLGAAALGVRNILCLTGDHPIHGDQPDAKAVFDVDSLQLIRIGMSLRQGRYLSGRPIAPAPDLFLGSTENPFAPPFDFRPLRLRKKIEAGARFVQTQIVFNPARFREFMKKVVELGIDREAPILAGVAPLRSARAARYMRDRIAGMEVPEALVRRMEGVPAQRAEEEGLRIGAEIIDEVRTIPGLAGLHLMPIHWEDAVAELCTRTGLRPARVGVAPEVPPALTGAPLAAGEGGRRA
ncbi:MAG TPA: methylenetetrahydrofolate reductase [Candidatus Polarisedimenticolia bacterium]|nr:methylenetetrahydrofolate reductase [Candidatus Polarisedimenticolia bacterium]